MNLEDFSVMDFPPTKNSLPGPPHGCVYILCWVADGVETPLYVGQTDRFSGRMNDYCLANFNACTDFCVGEAVKYLKSAKNYRVTVRYRPSLNPGKEEKAIIRGLLVSGVRLLNCLPRYDYRTDSKAEEREVVQRFCDMLAANHAGVTNGN